MARIFPFQPYRYAPAAGPLDRLVTQPYDKISPAMRERYLSLSPYNIVRVLLGAPEASDSASNNVYTRAAALLEEWIRAGVLALDPEPGYYAYFQEFTEPDTGDRLERRGFIGLGALEDYDARVVHRHEQTLVGPKKDRTELLKHTRAHFGQIFMLYPDPERTIDAVLDRVSATAPEAEIGDEYGVTHRLWRMSGGDEVRAVTGAMAPKKLIIADGHHRYETALAYSKANAALAGADRVMMTFVNMHSEGLRILATHRVVHSLAGFDGLAFVKASGARRLASTEELRAVFARPEPEKIRIGVALSDGVYLWERPRTTGELDVSVLHQEVLERGLGISAEAVREEKCIHYVRGIEAAAGMPERGEAQVAFLLEPTTIEQVAEVAFSGGVMPQKSTDFYPKLLSGLAIYRLG